MQHDRQMQRLSQIALLLAVLLAVLNLAASAFAAPAYPPLSGRVVDAAGVLPAAVAADLETRLKTLEDSTGTQLVVATVPDLEGLEIEEYGVGLLRHWGIGQKGTNNGAILLVAPAQRKLRIEVGYGLEGTLTDAMSGQIIRGTIVPRIKAGDMAGGIVAGADEIAALLQLPPDQQAEAAASAAQSQKQGKDSPGWGTLVWLIIIIVWVVLSARRGKQGRRRGPVLMWGPSVGGSWGGGS
ncbi:TPM domain-containing protein, partial [Sandarakinorhabdus sp.]|uniref:TPM domain-containing protein n=1 Tax=Sandarakinorhabdus sp. TaxID=1916663 RepID=UPI0033425062